MKITVVTCSYQQGSFLRAAMRSVLSQEYPSLEYIVVDGGSTDESVEIIKTYASQLAYWHSRKDAGQTAALIEGFGIATGEIMGWLCSDDLLLPGSLARVAWYFKKNPEVHAAFGDSIWIDENGDPIRSKKEVPFSRFVFLHDHNYIPQPSMFWRRSLYERVGGLRVGFDLAMDYDLWERFSRKGEIGKIPGYLSCMRFYDSQKTRRLRLQALHENRIVRRNGSSSDKVANSHLLHVLARMRRVAIKAAHGGYQAGVPLEVRAWLRDNGR